MEGKNIMKTLFRSPATTMLTFLLMASVTFGLLSQIGEFAVTSDAIDRSAELYSGAGTLESDTEREKYDTSFGTYIYADKRLTEEGLYCPDDRVTVNATEALTKEQISDAVNGLSHIQSQDFRVMTAGVSDTYYRPDDGEYFYALSDYCVIEGTLREVKINEDGLLMIGNVLCGSNQIVLSECRLIAGSPGRDIDGSEVTIWAYPETVTEFDYLAGELKRKVALYDTSFHYGTDYLQTMTAGDRYVLVIKYDKLYQSRLSSIPDTSDFHLASEAIRNNYCEPVQNITGFGEDYLEKEEFSALKLMCEIIDADDHTFDMVYTSDMTTIVRFAAGKMAITSGRMLTREDWESGGRVCVISEVFAEENDLKMGDILNFKLGTEFFEQYRGIGALALTPPRYSAAQENIQLTVVGIYADTDAEMRMADEADRCYSNGTVFLPASLLPEGVDLTGHTYTPAEYGFSVSSQEMTAFLQEDAPKLENSGLKLSFEDHGWPEIMDSYNVSKSVSLIRIAVLGAAIVIAIGFTVYLFIGRKKKDYAVMRALGTPAAYAKKSLLLSLFWLTAAAAAVGFASAWVYLAKTVSSSETIALLGAGDDSFKLPWIVAVFTAAELILTIAFANSYINKMEKTPLLLLLQGNISRRVKNRKKPPETHTPPKPHEIIQCEISPQINRPTNGKAKVGFTVQYVCRHIFRQKGKSLLAVLLAALLLVAVCQYSITQDSYKRICEETTVKAQFTEGIHLYDAVKLSAMEFTKDPYYEKTTYAELDMMPVTLAVTNDIARYTGKTVDVQYADGYDAGCMNKPNAVILVSKDVMERYGWRLGQTVTALLTQLQDDWIRGRGYSNYDELNEREKQLLDEYLLVNSCEYSIAGVVTGIENIVLTPGVTFVRPGTGENEMTLDYAEVTLSDYNRVSELREAGNTVFGTKMVFDTQALEGVLGTLKLLEKLYPMVIAGALLINGLFAALSIMLCAKEAAIMRILGTSSRKTRKILLLEQIALAVIGILLGVGALLIWKGSSLSGNYLQLIMFAGLYLTTSTVVSVVCAAAVTRKSLLELLQTKE